MKKRTILTTVVAFILLVAVFAAGLNAVFTVAYVNAGFLTYTPEGERAAQELKEELNGYLGTSTTFLDLSEVRATAEAYPRFRVVSVEKRYPAAVEIKIEERRAAFAMQAENGWDILDADGFRIDTVDSAQDHLVLAGDFSFSYRDGVIDGAYASQLLELYGVLSELLGEPRANVLSVTLEDRGNTSSDRFDNFRIAMREGVQILIGEPSVRAGDKARAALETYFSLSESERVTGTIITAINGQTGEVTAGYDDFIAAESE
ncbi:MAG TPA: FtsQ-type POTRA domain-containing protein [Firmicutes bacterium]|nr:FtsQ-type POTRA domain-containing protein [Bacillota bacterium]